MYPKIELLCKVYFLVFVPMQERKERLAEKRRKKLENERKGEMVQKVRGSVDVFRLLYICILFFMLKITNMAKLKRLKKKQLRNIEKR